MYIVINWKVFVHVFTLQMSKKQTPSEFLKKIIGRPVVVKLNSGVDYRGTKNKCITQLGACLFFNINALQ